MEYKTIAEAKKIPGLRLVLTQGSPAPWGESAKNIFFVKRIHYVAVGQQAGGDNAENVEWLGIRNAPVAIYNDERPRDRWIDIIMLAERMNPDIPLLPADPEERALAVGLTNEIAGEWGFGWCRRVEMVGPPPEPSADTAQSQRLRREYLVTKDAYDAAPKRTVQILEAFTRRLKAQRAAGSDYFVGKKLTAPDLYWAAFANILQPLPHDVCPLPDYFRTIYGTALPIVKAAADPILLEHRDFIYKNHLKFPLDF